MKKSMFNLSALKKQANKKTIVFAELENAVIFWNQSGTFAAKVSKFLFDTAIKNTIQTEQTARTPECITNFFETFEKNVDSVLIDTSLTMTLKDKTVHLYQNHKNKYITAIDIKRLNIIQDLKDFVPLQFKQISPVLFKSDMASIIICPVYNAGIKEQIIDLGESLK